MPLDATSTIELPISSIVHHQHLYPRHRHDPETVQRYASLSTAAPPICVNQDYIGIDYRHRTLAALERGETTIKAIIVPTRDDQHLLELAVSANFAHGLALSQSDKQRLAKLRYDPYSGNLTEQKEAIAAWLRVHPATVRRWLENVDHERRQTRNHLIIELDEQGFSQHKIAARVGCSVGHVNNRLRSEMRKCAEMNALPDGFQLQLYDEWRLPRNGVGIEHFGKTHPDIIGNLIWRYAREFDDAVLDLFAGSGTTVDVCRKWGRRCFAFDRKPRHPRGDDIQGHDIIIDGLLPELLCWDDIKLAFLDPPYAAQAAGQYSDDPTDLAHLSLDQFERVLSDLINALGTVLPAGAAIALLIRNTQWHAPDHRIRRHDRNIENLVTLEFEREIFCPLGMNATTTERAWAERTRDCLVISRKCLVWRV